MAAWGLLDDLDLIQDSSNRQYLVAKKAKHVANKDPSQLPLAAEQGAAGAPVAAAPAGEGASAAAGGAPAAGGGGGAGVGGGWAPRATDEEGEASGAAENDDKYAGIATFTAADRKQLQMGLVLLRQRLQKARLGGKGTNQGPAGAAGEEAGGGGSQGKAEVGGVVGPPPAHLVQQLRQNLLRSLKGNPPSVNVNKAGDPRQLFPPELVPYRKVRGRGGGYKEYGEVGCTTRLIRGEALMLGG